MVASQCALLLRNRNFPPIASSLFRTIRSKQVKKHLSLVQPLSANTQQLSTIPTKLLATNESSSLQSSRRCFISNLQCTNPATPYTIPQHFFSTETNKNKASKTNSKVGKARNQTRARRRRKTSPNRSTKRKPPSTSTATTKRILNTKSRNRYPQQKLNNRYPSNYDHHYNSRKKSNASMDSIRLYKMERRLTYLLSNYYELLGVSMSRLNGSSDQNTYVYTNPHLSLPYYSSISTPNLASILLHPSLKYNSYPKVDSENSSSVDDSTNNVTHSSSSTSVVPYETLVQSELVYQQVQSTIRQIIIGWIYAQDVDMDVHTNANISKKFWNYKDGEFHGDGNSNGERTATKPNVGYSLQMEYDTSDYKEEDDDGDDEISENSNNQTTNTTPETENPPPLPFKSAVQVLRAQYPIRAEIWLDKMEELRSERDQLIQRSLQRQDEENTIFRRLGSMVSNIIGGIFSKEEESTGKKNLTLSAHLDPKYTPTTSLYLKLLRAHRLTYYRKILVDSYNSNIDASTRTVDDDSANGIEVGSFSSSRNSPLSSPSSSLSFLSSKAITKRQENLFLKSQVSQKHGNPNVDPREDGMILYEELLKQYAHVGEKANEANEICREILQYRQSLYEQYEDRNEKENKDNHDHRNWFSRKPTLYQMKKDASLIRLVMKAYAKDSLSNGQNALRTEELLQSLKEMEVTRNLPKGTLATPESYNQCLRAYQLAGSKALPDITARTQRLFHEISTQVWENDLNCDDFENDEEEMEEVDLEIEADDKDEGRDLLQNTESGLSSRSTTSEPSHRRHKSHAKMKMERDLIDLYNRVISIYGSSMDVNYLHKAKSILQYMEKTYIEPGHKFQIPPNTWCFNLVLRGFIQQREKNTKIVAHMGASFLNRMMVLPNAKPNYETYALLLQLWMLSAPSSVGIQSEKIFSQLEADAILTQQLLSSKRQNKYNSNYGDGAMPEVDVKMYTRLIRNWGLAAARMVPNSAQRAYDILCRMEVESGTLIGIDPEFGESPFCQKNLRPDTRTYENVIGVCIRTSDPEEYDKALEIAFATYERMVQLKLKPDVIGMLKCVTNLVPSAQSRKRSALAEKVLQTGIEHGQINDAVKGVLRKCSPDVYDDYFGDSQ